MDSPDPRLRSLQTWLATALGREPESLEPASSDASFRRYFRARVPNGTYIVMDAPPPREDVRPFVKLAGLLREAGMQTPALHAADIENGFLLLGDFGSRAYLDALNVDSADRLYGDALAALEKLQSAALNSALALPAYDEPLLRRELGIFVEWFLRELLAIRSDEIDAELLESTWRKLVESALEQPQVLVHRDFHSRNLMVTDRDNPGVLDFQDAVVGPVTYDLVSLLRDCYVEWPDGRVRDWMAGYHRRLVAQGIIGDVDLVRFSRWFDWMGMQRHLKAIGIFSRLKLRDGKPGYLKDIPRTLGYVASVAANYPEFADFSLFLRQQAQPRWNALGIA